MKVPSRLFMRLAVAVSLLGTAALAAGCTGNILSTGQDGTGAPGTAGAGASSAGGAGAGGAGATIGGPGATPGQPEQPGDPTAAGPMPVRRLTNREYNNTVH